MKKKARKSLPPVTPVTAQAVPLIDLGKRLSVTVVSTDHDHIKVKLDDGTELQFKPVLMGIERSLSKFNSAGDPIYQISAGMMLNVVVPKKLKRKVKVKKS